MVWKAIIITCHSPVGDYSSWCNVGRVTLTPPALSVGAVHD